MGSEREPLMRTIPMPLSPNGVEMAAIVSSFPGEILMDEMDKKPLFNGADSFPFLFLWDDYDLLHGPFPYALCLNRVVFLKGDMNDSSVTGIEGADFNFLACAFSLLSQLTGHLD